MGHRTTSSCWYETNYSCDCDLCLKWEVLFEHLVIAPNFLLYLHMTLIWIKRCINRKSVTIMSDFCVQSPTRCKSLQAISVLQTFSCSHAR